MHRSFLLLLSLSQIAFSQTTWLSDQFKRTELGSQWTPTSGAWTIADGTVKITTIGYDQLLASAHYVYGTTPFSLEVTLRGIHAGVFFSLETTDSKAISHMVRFDEKSILTGYMNAVGEYTATNVFDVEKMPTGWTTLRLDVDPSRRRYEVFVNGKSVGVDEHLVFGSGYIGLEASDGLSEFKSVKLTGKGKNAAPGTPRKGAQVTFQHVAYVQTVGQNLVIHDPERGMMLTLDPEGKFLNEFAAKITPVSQREAAAGELRYMIEGKRVLVKNEQDAVVDSITERLVMPSCLLTDYDLARSQAPSLFVADPGANAIHQFNLNGDIIKSFTAASIGGLIAPRCIAFRDSDQIVIADYNRLVIVKKNLEDITPEVQSLSPTSVAIMWPRSESDKGQPFVQFSGDGKNWTTVKGGDEGLWHAVELDKLTPLTRYSYKLTPTFNTIPPQSASSREFRCSTPPSDSSMMACTRLRVLCMVYRTISYRDVYPRETYPQIPDGRTITDEELDYLRDACKFNTDFYFRNSSCKLMLDFDFYVVQDTLWLHELGDKDPYWLSCNERVTRDFERAAKSFGMGPTDYAGLICPYAWVNYPPRRKSALSDPTTTDSINIRQAYGGGTNGVPAPWKYGKTTGYTGNPFQDKFSRQDWLITHEFHHQIDALMEASGYPEYYHADQPWKMPGRFGEDFDFNAQIIRKAGLDWWLNLKFGILAQTMDADHDGVPDDDLSLPFDEKRLGGDPTKKDSDGDWLDDLQEVMAGTTRGSALNNKDTDEDGIPDGQDTEPLYPVVPTIVRSELRNELDLKSMDSTSYKFADIPFEKPYASINAYWSDNGLYLEYVSIKPQNFLVQIDANCDGWFHGFDNFQIRIKNTQDSTKVLDYYLRDCSSWTDPPKDRKDILHIADLKIISGVATLTTGDEREAKKFLLTVMIPANPAYGLGLYKGKKIGIRIGLQTTDDRWVWDELFERNYMMQVELK